MQQPTNRSYEEITIHTQPIYQGKVISLQVDEVQLPNGQTSTREIVKHPGAVAILALRDDKLLVVEQYRKALEKHQVEIPAGKLDFAEHPDLAAMRELEEETGYRARSIRKICAFYTSPGFADELLHVYLAEDLEKGEVQLDDDEFLHCDAITFEQAEQYIADQRISDAKTIFAVYAWKLYRLTGKF